MLIINQVNYRLKLHPFFYRYDLNFLCIPILVLVYATIVVECEMVHNLGWTQGGMDGGNCHTKVSKKPEIIFKKSMAASFFWKVTMLLLQVQFF